MNGLKSLHQIYHKKGLDFIDKLLNNYLIINSAIKSSYFAFTYIDGEFTFYKKSGKITKIDRIISKYYEPAINIVKRIPKIELNDQYLYAFNYDADNKNLTIAYIMDVRTKKYYHDSSTLNKLATQFNVTPPPILFEGYLTNNQKIKVLDYIYNSENDGEFTQHLLNILNIDTAIDYDSLIFRFYNETKDTTIVAKLINPDIRGMKDTMVKQEYKSNDYIYILLIDLINYIESYTISELDKYVYKSNSFEENYILMINKIFKDFIKHNGNNYLDIKFNSPDYLNSENFEINYQLITDKEVLKLLKLNDNFKEIYKILLNFFRTTRNTTNDIFNNDILLMFNSLVKKLHSILLTEDLFERYYPTYNEYQSKLSDVNVKHFDNDISEKEEVNLIIDDFDIINNGHLELAKSLYNKNNKPSIFIVIDDGENVYDVNTRMELINNCIVNIPYIKMVNYIEDSDLKHILDSIKTSYYPVICATNDNHFENYVHIIDNIKNLYNNNLKIIDVVIKKDSNIMEYIKNRDYNSFKKETPECIHHFFFKLEMNMNSN